MSDVLGYAKWANFVPTVEAAMRACEGSGQAVSDHFLEVRKLIETGKGARRGVQDFHRSRYACYLVVMNGDTSKPIVALGQTYIAVQTRRAELAEEALLQGMSEDRSASTSAANWPATIGSSPTQPIQLAYLAAVSPASRIAAIAACMTARPPP